MLCVEVALGRLKKPRNLVNKAMSFATGGMRIPSDSVKNPDEELFLHVKIKLVFYTVSSFRFDFSGSSVRQPAQCCFKTGFQIQKFVADALFSSRVMLTLLV
ncbi:hypothetical protein NPIL_158251 [Nephila pilipes]|uniref:Uncharacterized protein n=1 Tax=Nephila pilipes TaxID=299642 RepID=A0A8X6TVB2_NEPPI|nr:hypothetical protein NPIL_158251 [Nephila pilipes]